MKDRLLKIFLLFVRKTFSKDRLLDLIDDLLVVVYDRYAASDGRLEERMLDQSDSFDIWKEALDKDV